MEKCTRRVNSFFVQVCSKDSTGPDGGLDPFAFSFQLGLPQYMLALEADTWEAALVCLQSTASFSDLKAEDRFFHLFQENTEAEHKFEIPLSAFKDSEFLKTTFISEFQAFIRTRIQPQDQLNFNIPTCNFVDDRLFINYNGCGYRVILKDNYLYRALGFAAPEYQPVLDTGAPALDGLKARQPIDAATGRSFAAVQTDLLLARPWRDSQQQTLAWIPVTTKSRSIDLFEPRYLAYYPVKYVKTGDRVNIHLVLRYQVQDNLTFSQCPLPGETVVVLHVKKISADE